MKVERYSNEAHLQFLRKWAYLRDAYVPSKTEMPETGVVVYKGVNPIAMAFLRKIECGFAQVDGLISNPEASSEERNQALDLVIQEVIDIAKKLGVKSLTAYTRDESTLLRSMRNGFEKLPHTVVAIDLS